MVKICSDTYADNDVYQEHFEMFPYPLSPFQKYAIEGIVTGNHVLVTAPTGSGKTLPAEFAIQHFVKKGKKVLYCSPIKSLSNQKFYEFSKRYEHISFGISTGDTKINPNADVIICTTEILQNYLFAQTNGSAESNLNFQIDIQNELECVIFDEVHYINDQERGQVWEKTFLMLPEHIQTVSLSATIDNPQGFAEWIENRYAGKNVYLASTHHRIVPLTHYGYITTTEAIFKVVKDKDTQKQIRDNTNVLIDLQSAGGKFNDAGYLTLKKYTKLLDDNHVRINRKHALNQLALFLRDRDMLPAIAFVFSRKNVEAMAKEITVPLLEDDSKIPYTTSRECEQILRKLPNYTEYLQLPEYVSLVSLLEKGIGIHHSGMIPVLREIVELFIAQKKIKLLFATESFAIGLDCPIRTAIFTSLTKFDGNTERYLMSHEYTQMAGRAGRRGIDTVGHVVHCNNLFSVPTLGEYKTMLGGVPQTLVSKFHISHGLVLNLIKNGTTAIHDVYAFCDKSMVRGELDKVSVALKKRIAETEATIEKKKEVVKLKPTPVEVCRDYLRLEETLKTSVNKKRKECERAISALKDEHKHLLKDIVAVKELDDWTDCLKHDSVTLKNNESHIKQEVDAICELLVTHGFIVRSEDDKLEFTMLGKIASCLAEVNPLIMAKMLVDTSMFNALTSRQLVGLLSCYTDVKIADDIRLSIPKCSDVSLNAMIQKMVGLTETFERAEQDGIIYTGIRYDKLLMFDMVQYAMDWCDCTTEQECKYFIQAVISEKGISVGDFTKAMMKIVTISKELENVCETAFNGEQVELLHKLRQIEGLVLKYVLTSQSLYI